MPDNVALREQQAVSGRYIGKYLHEEGLLPPRCNLVEVSIAPTGGATIRYTVFVTGADMSKLARALAKASGAPSEPETVTDDAG